MHINSIYETDNKISVYLTGLLGLLEELIKDPLVKVKHASIETNIQFLDEFSFFFLQD